MSRERLIALVADTWPAEVARVRQCVRCARQPDTLFGSPETIISGAVSEAAKLSEQWGNTIASAVDGFERPEQIDRAIVAAGKRLNVAEFARIANEQMMRGLMLGALDAEWEATTDVAIEPPRFAARVPTTFPTQPPPPKPSGVLVTNPYAKAVEWFRAKKVIPRGDFDALSDAAKRKAFTVAGMASKSLLLVTREELARQVAQGANLKDFAKFAKERLESAGWTPANPSHLECIYRTNVVSTYGAGRYAQMTQPTTLALRPYWQIVTVNDGPPRQRPTHQAVHLWVLRADDPIWSRLWTPFGYSCRCRIRSMAAAQVKRLGLTIHDGSEIRDLPDPGFTSGIGNVLGPVLQPVKQAPPPPTQQIVAPKPKPAPQVVPHLPASEPLPVAPPPPPPIPAPATAPVLPPPKKAPPPKPKTIPKPKTVAPAPPQPPDPLPAPTVPKPPPPPPPPPAPPAPASKVAPKAAPVASPPPPPAILKPAIQKPPPKKPPAQAAPVVKKVISEKDVPNAVAALKKARKLPVPNVDTAAVTSDESMVLERLLKNPQNMNAVKTFTGPNHRKVRAASHMTDAEFNDYWPSLDRNEFAKIGDAIDAAFSGAPKTKGVVVRGIENIDDETVAKLLNATHIEASAATSTTYKQSVAAKFMGPTATPGRWRMLFQLDQESGMAIGRASQSQYEYEILVRKGTRFEITSVERHGDDILVVKAKETTAIPTGAPKPWQLSQGKQTPETPPNIVVPKWSPTRRRELEEHAKLWPDEPGQSHEVHLMFLDRIFEDASHGGYELSPDGTTFRF